MSKKYLFVAEADKIQDLLFRSARQRQVIGGSRLLAQFGVKMKKQTKNAEHIMWRGGSFVISFESEDEALKFREDLQNLYHLVFDSTITCTVPHEYIEDSDESVNQADDELTFGNVNEKLHRQLAENKRANRPVTDSAHSPITAYCQDTGTGLAVAHQSLLPGEKDNKKYLSQTALDFGHAGGLGSEENPKSEKTRIESSDENDSFLAAIRGEINHTALKTNGVWPENVDELGKLDTLNRNVAYMLADVNGMGEIVKSCDSKNLLKDLSEALDLAMKEALAEPVSDLFNQLKFRINEDNLIPMLPLIFAGDDAFVLLPAHYSLDFAARFCDQFQKKMQEKLSSEKLEPLQRELEEKSIPSPTISAAVVFCKTKFPYHLAHQRGEFLLKNAKRLAKSHTGNQKQYGAICFEIIVGNQLVKPLVEEDKKYRSTLQPYWVTEPGAPELKEQTLALNELLKFRLKLKDIPQKRWAELRELFAQEQLDELVTKENVQKWTTRFEAKLGRFKTVFNDNADLWKNLSTAIDKLGSNGTKQQTNPYWHVTREDDFYYHGLPDLIAIWNYAQDLKHELSEYS